MRGWSESRPDPAETPRYEAPAICIVGAGIHGTAVATRILQELPDAAERLVLVDPNPRCLADWSRRTSRQCMETMRSPAAHHLDSEPDALIRYAEAVGRTDELAAPYACPSLSLFMSHARTVVERHGLDDRILRAGVEDIRTARGGYVVRCSNGSEVHAAAVIITSGMRGHALRPSWSGHPAAAGRRLIRHSDDFDVRSGIRRGGRLVVIGGGLTAAQVAVSAGERGISTLMVSRRTPRTSRFDVDPGWIGPKLQRHFRREADPTVRLRMLESARPGGTITPEARERLRREIARGSVEHRDEEEVTAARVEGNRVRLTLKNAGREVTADAVCLATGYAPRLDRLRWLQRLARCVPQISGRPLIGPTLELQPACFVTGWLAELWIGPHSRNIAGARQAADVIVERLGHQRQALLQSAVYA